MKNLFKKIQFKKTLKVGGELTLGAIGTIVAAAIIFVFVGLLVSTVWNMVIPYVFGLPTLGMWQGLALIVLTRILFFGFGSSKKE